jgi:nicotinate-nucleotide adenylyltransferase
MPSSPSTCAGVARHIAKSIRVNAPPIHPASSILHPSADAPIGVFGGAFDPIHNGHLAIAEAARAHFALSMVLFVPTGAAPHKPRGRASAEERFAMTALAVADFPGFAVSRVEIDRPGRSFMVDTLRELTAQYSGHPLVLILGADMAIDFPTWRDPAGIRALATVVAAARPGVRESAWHTACVASGIVPFPAPQVNISSTALRAAVTSGRPITTWVPAAVEQYILAHRFYLSSPARSAP